MVLQRRGWGCEPLTLLLLESELLGAKEGGDRGDDCPSLSGAALRCWAQGSPGEFCSWFSYTIARVLLDLLNTRVLNDGRGHFDPWLQIIASRGASVSKGEEVIA